MSVFIREAKTQDAETIGKLAAQTFTETFEWYNTAENMRDYNETHLTKNIIEDEIADERSVLYVAIFAEEIVGYAKLKDSETPAELGNSTSIEIERLYVKKDFHNKKVGLALMNFCIEKAKEKNAEIIWLGVWEQNPRAINFYTRVGFSKFGQHVFQLGDDAQIDYLMKMDLK
ncbi:MAG: GNAT family N-acetyltransferase [Bacteroidia bacterium]